MPTPESEMTAYNSPSGILVREFIRLFQTNCLPEGRKPRFPREHAEMKMRGLAADALASTHAQGRIEGLEEAAKIAATYGANEESDIHTNHAVASNAGQNIAAAIRSRITKDQDNG